MNKTTSPQRPIFRVSFARIKGRDDDGKDILGYAQTIGSVWPRQDKDGNIIRLDHCPVELTRHQGVLFLNPVSEQN